MISLRRCILAVGFLFLCLTSANASIGVPSANPYVIPTGQATSVTISAHIPDVTLIPTSVNLLRVAENGTSSVMGSLNDQGINGDATAGDKIFTTAITFNEAVGTTVRLRISAALKGTLKRITRDFKVLVATVPTIQDYSQYNQTIDDIFVRLVNTRNNFVAASDASTSSTQFFEYLQNSRNNLLSVYASLYSIY